MSQQELVIEASRILEKAGIPHMFTGSTVSSIQGEPRLTHDIDIVVAIQAADIPKLSTLFPQPTYYFDEHEARDAIAQSSMFNVIAIELGEKIDFWTLTDEPFDQARFSRRYREGLFGTGIYVSSPEDTILAKLRWAKMSGGSEKQLLDALRVLEVQGKELDQDYLAAWAIRLEVRESWERIKREAGG